MGTETDGSIVCPSSVNGLVGIKPTVGRVSRSGIIPISHTQDMAGPMARTVEDAAIPLSALAGVDSEDPATLAAGGGADTNYAKFLAPHGLGGACLGIVRSFFKFNPEVAKLIDSAPDGMKRHSAEIVDPVKIESLEKIDGSEYQVLLD